MLICGLFAITELCPLTSSTCRIAKNPHLSTMDRSEEDVFNRRFPDEEEAEEWADEEEAHNVIEKCEVRTNKSCPVRKMKKLEEWARIIDHQFRNYEKGVAGDVWNEVQGVAKAICLVRRLRGSEIRKEFHTSQAQDKTLHRDVRESHRSMAREWRRSASGTGVLWSSDPPWVTVNNHVIMNQEEADNGEVFFDYDHDTQRKGQTIAAPKFSIKGVISSSLRTAFEEDTRTLDFTVLELKSDEPWHPQFLEDHALFDQHGRAPRALKDEVPFLMISHPHGLGKRLSWGTVQRRESEPFTHVVHDLATCTGSSGANLFFYDWNVTKEDREKLVTAFVHYRHHRAVDCDAILETLRDDGKLVHEDCQRVLDVMRNFIQEMGECAVTIGAPDEARDMARTAKRFLASYYFEAWPIGPLESDSEDE